MKFSSILILAFLILYMPLMQSCQKNNCPAYQSVNSGGSSKSKKSKSVNGGGGSPKKSKGKKEDRFKD